MDDVLTVIETIEHVQEHGADIAAGSPILLDVRF